MMMIKLKKHWYIQICTLHTDCNIVRYLLITTVLLQVRMGRYSKRKTEKPKKLLH